jgi:hypothetical protein
MELRPDRPRGASTIAEQDAYRRGFQAGRLDMLARIGELDRVWRPVARRTDAQRISERLTDMETVRQRWWATHIPGRPAHDHPGGPVDWDTGQSVSHTYVLRHSHAEGVAA